ncbi:ATP-binding protein [Streptomyces cellostaticus]|uniref:ATP-binding protein n=1 Tax=Streptomyces cellostaticus TaxID=67285 RepID=A0A101NI48_9ACTN|nr:YfjP family GTPase [Streptomyces cellostaticus]KUM93716.1 ATP-binding protein [Streptomyces cellostaticus]
MTAVADHDHTDHTDHMDHLNHLNHRNHPNPMGHSEQGDGSKAAEPGSAAGRNGRPRGESEAGDRHRPVNGGSGEGVPGSGPSPDQAAEAGTDTRPGGRDTRTDGGRHARVPEERVDSPDKERHVRVPKKRMDGPDQERQARVPKERADSPDRERRARVAAPDADAASGSRARPKDSETSGDGGTARGSGTPRGNGTARGNGRAGGSGRGGDAGGAGDAGRTGDGGRTGEAGRAGGSGRAGDTGRAGDAGRIGDAGRAGDGGAAVLGPDADPDLVEVWDDGLIARRVTEGTAAALAAASASALDKPIRGPGSSRTPARLAYDGPLRSRLDALRELVGLSRTRLDSSTLSEAGRVLDEAAARRKLSGQHTVVAIAGATGSGKSQLFNALAGVAISETGVRRPTTAAPIACSWSDGAAGLIDRLGIPGRLRRRPVQGPEAEAQLRGLVLVDLPDHDSAAVQHREQVDRILKLVDAVIWVVDPEKYADAILHERYLRPMAGHAEVMFIVLNQIDRLPGEAADQVLDDLRRLLDEDGVALGEYGEPGATVLALSALTGEGVGELRESLGDFVAERGAPARRVAADLDAAADRLRPVYATGRRVGLSEEAREEFAARLADAVGATAAGEAAERAWLRNANRACGTPWLRLWRWYQGRGEHTTGRIPVRPQADEEATARQRVEQAVRTVSDRASAGLPTPWAQAVREAAVRGSQGLSEALDELAARAGLPPGRPPRPGWWPAAVLVQAAMTLLQMVGGAWLAGQIAGVMAPNLGVPVLLMMCGIVGGPLVEWGCRMAARGPARRYGLDAERRLREAAAGCGRARVLDPLAAELLRYREVREQYGRVARTGAGAGVG